MLEETYTTDTVIKLNIVTVNILFTKCLLNFIYNIYSTFKT